MFWSFSKSVKTIAVGLLLAVCSLQTADAQRATKGDLVDVFVQGKWYEGKVVDTSAREVLVELEFAGRLRRSTFKRNQVRQKFEIGALSKLRNWFGSDGKRMFLAVLIASDGETVTLRKPDMSETKVALNKLRDNDQKLVARLAKSNPGGSPSAGPGAVSPLHPKFPNAPRQPGRGADKRGAIEPDPLPAEMTITQGGTAFSQRDLFEEIAAVVPVGGPESWLLVATRHTFDKPGRLIWISTANNEASQQQVLPPGEVVLDYDPTSHRLLTQANHRRHPEYGDAVVLTLWSVQPADTRVKGILRWDVTPDSGRGPREPWGRIVGDGIVVHRYTKSGFVGWDTEKKQALYRVVQEAFFQPTPVVSGGRRYLFVPNDKSMRVFDARTGKLVSFMPAADGVTGIAVTADGTRAATLGRNKLSVWDLTSATAEPKVYQAEAIGSPFGSQLSWVGTDRVLASQPASGMSLFDFKHELTLWNYQTEAGSKVSGGGRVREVIADHLVYAASVREGGINGFAVGAASLPGPRVEEVTASLDPDSLLILKRGSAVRLEVDTRGYEPQVRAALEKEVRANNWTISPTAAVTLKASMGRGKPQTVTYEFSNGSKQSVTVSPYFSQLQLLIGSTVAWQAGNGSGGAPSAIMLKKGESAQSKVNEWAKPNPGFFERVDIPEKISDPAKRGGLGRTNVTNRGLVVQE